ncbi:hypothetical protein ACHAXR_009307 [Thalassiosira sp. AJA248-18]
MWDITTDEYGRTFCAAHNLARCHICCMDFIEPNEVIDENPSDRNVGVFIPDASLMDWYDKMKVKMPRIYRKDDNIFGNDSGQHPYGTKLSAHFDCTVVGSKWKKDELAGMGNYSCVDGREPVYVVYFSNEELSLIELTSAHGKGWEVVGHDSSVNERIDALARAHQNLPARGYHDKKEDESDDNDRSVEEQEFYEYEGHSYPLPPQSKRIRREGKAMKPWDKATNGDFLEQLYLHYFSAEERGRIGSSGGQESMADKIKAYPIGSFIPHGSNFYARLVVAKMATYFSEDGYSVILQNEQRTKFQAVELNECHANQNLAPCIRISYATDPEGIENPKQYLDGDKIKVMELPNRLAVAVEEHLLNCVSNEGTNDIGSSLLYHEGYLVPMEIVLREEEKTSVVNSTSPTIPDVNFGVELEGSCASGNKQSRVASSIAEHAQIDVRIGHGGKGGKGGTKGGYSHQKGSSKGSDCHGSDSHNTWKLVYDKSIEANVQNPQSLTFEFVSRVLCGKSGLDEMSQAIMVLTDVACVRINESMGLHVHVEAKPSCYSLEQMKSICQQFLLYEDVMDSFLPFHRRTGAEKCHSYFESNRLSVMACHGTFKKSLEGISFCNSRQELYDLMNPGYRERYHKLNLQNLDTGRQPTIEFRQHHATKDEKEVEMWVCFCVLFAVNAAKLPVLLDGSISKDATFDGLFDTIIKRPILKEYYYQKKAKFEKRHE